MNNYFFKFIKIIFLTKRKYTYNYLKMPFNEYKKLYLYNHDLMNLVEYYLINI